MKIIKYIVIIIGVVGGILLISPNNDPARYAGAWVNSTDGFMLKINVGPPITVLIKPAGGGGRMTTVEMKQGKLNFNDGRVIEYKSGALNFAGNKFVKVIP
jgi:hypothetical protein